MDATPGTSSPKRSEQTGPISEFIILSGRLKGTRRALGMPFTFIGRAPGCDIRLNVAGVNPLHCLVAQGPEGFLLRDLDTENGTFVNGTRVSSCDLRDGDVVVIGPFHFKAHLPRSAPAAPPPGRKEQPLALSPDREALRIQVAAVVAQQAGLAEEEARLVTRRATLEQQESQLAAHLEDKRRRLVELRGQAQAARDALRQEKEAFGLHVEKVTGDLTQSERELLQKQQAAARERQHLIEMRRRLKQRYRQHRSVEREALRRRERELAEHLQRAEEEGEALRREKAALAQTVARFNGDAELGRRHLQDAWDKVRREQKLWKDQRVREEAELREFAYQLDQREAQQAAADKAVAEEQARWAARRMALEKELEGLENRSRNQRRKVFDRQQEIDKLDKTLVELRQRADPSTTPEALTGAEPPAPAAADQAPQTGTALVVRAGGPAATDPGPESATALQPRLDALERVAGDLEDQRLQLAEQWERLAQTRQHWLEERNLAGAELKALAVRLHQQAQTMLAREQELESGAADLRQRHHELLQLRQHLLGWQSRLRTRETTWEGERDRMVGELRAREQLVEKQLASLVEVRQRWARRRRQELELARAERDACEKVRLQYAALRDERRRKNRELEEERRNLTAKALALEQYRREFLGRTGDAAATERRVERLRRRWVTENAAGLRTIAREREALQVEADHLQERYRELQKRAEELNAEKSALAERVTDWEHRQTVIEAQYAQTRLEVQNLLAQRERANQQIAEMQGEVERIARQLLEEPDAPPVLLDKAA